MESLASKRTYNHGMTRRHFLRLTAVSGAGLALGCATSPVTGKRQFMLVSEEDELQIDKQRSPHQFSADYGPLQDRALNAYLDRTGKRIASLTHRPHLPYSFRGVNATYVNAYTFPGGSVGVTRGVLLSLNNESELAALLGHELGHVNARHTAQQMSKSMVTSALVSGITIFAGTQGAVYGELASQLGMLGAGALLASYSRDNEREADSLGMEYMVRTEYTPQGMVGLMDMLRKMSKRKPSAIELMFATHPMSDERYRTAVQESQTKHASAKDFPTHRERYMDNTATLRTLKSAIEELQNGEGALVQKKYGDAETHFRKALKQAPNDYAGLVMMSKCQLLQKKHREAQRYAESATHVYPQEAQAYHLLGFAEIALKDFDSAHEAFSTYEKLLPGNPNTIFFRGYSLEGMKKIKEAASQYQRYLQIVNQGEQAQYAYRRLVEWGYIKR
jgi:predicted Zn-dependent protease